MVQVEVPDSLDHLIEKCIKLVCRNHFYIFHWKYPFSYIWFITLFNRDKSNYMNKLLRPRPAASINTVSFPLSLSLSKKFFLLRINIYSVCVCVTLSVYSTMVVVISLTWVSKKMSAITKVYLDNVRNIFLKLAEFNKFYLKFWILSKI